MMECRKRVRKDSSLSRSEKRKRYRECRDFVKQAKGPCLDTKEGEPSKAKTGRKGAIRGGGSRKR